MVFVVVLSLMKQTVCTLYHDFLYHVIACISHIGSCD